jgi:hypothetical protein
MDGFGAARCHTDDTDIGFLAQGPNGNGLVLEFGIKGLRKTWETPRIFLRALAFSVADCPIAPSRGSIS